MRAVHLEMVDAAGGDASTAVAALAATRGRDRGELIPRLGRRAAPTEGRGPRGPEQLSRILRTSRAGAPTSCRGAHHFGRRQRRRGSSCSRWGAEAGDFLHLAAVARSRGGGRGGQGEVEQNLRGSTGGLAAPDLEPRGSCAARAASGRSRAGAGCCARSSPRPPAHVCHDRRGPHRGCADMDGRVYARARGGRRRATRRTMDRARRLDERLRSTAPAAVELLRRPGRVRPRIRRTSSCSTPAQVRRAIDQDIGKAPPASFRVAGLHPGGALLHEDTWRRSSARRSTATAVGTLEATSTKNHMTRPRRRSTPSTHRVYPWSA